MKARKLFLNNRHVITQVIVASGIFSHLKHNQLHVAR